MACEKCWADAYADARMRGGHQADHYRRLIAEREDDPCTPDQQRGEIIMKTPTTKREPRPINVIVEEIAEDWQPPNYAAVPYIEAMRQVRGVEDMYYQDDAKSIVLYFLSNAQSWRGETARRIKAELRSMVA